MNNRNNEIEKFSFKEFFSPIFRYKYGFLFIFILILSLSIIYLKISSPVYKTYATLEISETSSKGSKDILLDALVGESVVNLETEIDLIKSRSIISKALEYIPYRVQYFEKKGLQTIELYKNAPFEVNIYTIKDKEIYRVPIKVRIIDDNTFELSITPSLKDKILGISKSIEYKGIHRFGEKIDTGLAILSLKKRGKFLSKNYIFKLNTKLSFVEKVRKNLYVHKTSKDSYLIKIEYTDNVPKRAKEVVNAIAYTYLKQTINLKTLAASTKLKFIDDQLKEISKNLKESEVKLANFKKEKNLIDLDKETEVIIQKLSDLDNRIANLRIRENAVNILYKYMKSGKDLSSLPIGSVGINDPILISLVNKLNDSKVKLKELLVEYTDKHPDVIKEKNTISKLENDIKFAINSLKSEIEAQKNALQNMMSQYKIVFKSLPENERHFIELKRRFIINEKIYSYLLEKKVEASIAKAATISKNRIIDRATEPTSPVKPKKPIILLLGGFLGLFLGVMYSYVRDFINDTIQSDEDIRKISVLPILGIVPKIKSRLLKNNVFVLKDPKSIFAEAFRLIRLNIRFLNPQKEVKTIVVSSTIEKEGKTTVAVNLGGIFALSNKKTILIDLDLRKPNIHNFFNIKNEKGVTDYILGQISLDQAIRKTDNKYLDIIPVGILPPNPSELLLSDKIKALISELKNSYDYVIIDSPPIGRVADSLLLMKDADASVIVLKANYSKRIFVSLIDRKVKELDLKNVGFVLNGVKKRNISYQYGYAYGYK